MYLPRVLVSGLSGGGGKTLVSVGLVAAWQRMGRAVVPFKKGPDYIDAAWLSQAAGGPCRNLDLFLMEPDAIRQSVTSAEATGEAAVIEGNRGLFDGADAQGTCSSAELAKLLSTPVLLVVDCTKTTRTAAALVLGCQRLDPAVRIGGVVLNRVAGSRHESVLRQAIEDACGLPVLGALPRFERPPFPERHLGLVPPQEHAGFADAVEEAGRSAERYLDLDGIWTLAKTAPPLHLPESEARIGATGVQADGSEPARVGVFRDAAFQFYYPENLEALERAGARLVEISPLEDGALPDVHALYIGGGFPETFADRLAGNASFRDSLRTAVHSGLPVYAECGGAVYLGQELLIDGAAFAMAGAIPATFAMGERPAGHGYVVLDVESPNPFFDVGESVRGHEFHYSFLRAVATDEVTFAFRVKRGHGCDGSRDGICYRNTLASYTHIHALSERGWAPALVGAALRGRPAEAMSDFATVP